MTYFTDKKLIFVHLKLKPKKFYLTFRFCNRSIDKAIVDE